MQWLLLAYILTGSANVLLIKLSDILLGECTDGKWRHFQHPVIQTALMFLGQLLCFVLYKIVYFFLQRRGDGSENDNLITRGGREFSVWSFVLPAFLDTIASVLLFTGLYLTYASSFQMIRGAALIFVGIFGAIHLNQSLIARHWMAIFTISSGIVVILSIDVQRIYYDHSFLFNSDANSIMTGNLLIICAQVFHAAQWVYLEKHMKGADIAPMQAVGWQGIFGFAITALLAICTNYLPTQRPFDESARGVFDSVDDAFTQIRSNPSLLLALSAFIVCSAVYSYLSLSIVKLSSTITRILTDGLRVIFIWWMSLLFGWEDLNFITILGFIILEMGVVAYRNAIFIEWYRSLLARIQRRRFDTLVAEQNDGNAVPSSRPADII